MSITLTTVILFAVFGVLLFLGVPISISIVAVSYTHLTLPTT